MKLNFYIAILIVISVFQSCIDSSHHTGHLDYVSHDRANEKHLRNGLKELKSFRETYKDQWINLPSTFPYSKHHIIKVFSLNCEGDCFKPEFTHRTDEGLIISEEHFQELMSILENPKSYSNTTTDSFAPKIGLVLYDTQGIPSEYLSISLEYNGFRTYPGKVDNNGSKMGFSQSARQKLRTLFKLWGIDYYGFSEEWDERAAYKRYLEEIQEEKESNYTI